MASILIAIGASGWIGREFTARNPNSVCVPTAEVLARGAQAVFESAMTQKGADQLVVVNLAGIRVGSRDDMQRVNSDLVADIASSVSVCDGHLVHLGSAAEFGLAPGVEWITDEVPCTPRSDYGVTKHDGTCAALESGRAIVLRAFNIAANPPQPSSPLDDMCRRIAAGIVEQRPITLLSPRTKRDYVPLDFVVDSLSWASQHRQTGAFTLGSGIAIEIADFATKVTALIGRPAEVSPHGAVDPTTIAADPMPWYNTSGLRTDFDADRLAAMMAPYLAGLLA